MWFGCSGKRWCDVVPHFETYFCMKHRNLGHLGDVLINVHGLTVKIQNFEVNQKYSTQWNMEKEVTEVLGHEYFKRDINTLNVERTN